MQTRPTLFITESSIIDSTSRYRCFARINIHCSDLSGVSPPHFTQGVGYPTGVLVSRGVGGARKSQRGQGISEGGRVSLVVGGKGILPCCLSHGAFDYLHPSLLV